MLPTAPATPVPIDLAFPTQRRSLTRVVLRPGVVDEDARELFSFGYCHLLAAALYERTGWPLVVIEQAKPSLGGAWGWAHVGILTPAGLFLDIDGATSQFEIERDWQRYGPSVRLRVLDTLTEFHCALGLPADTPGSWWRDQISTPAAIEAIRSIADRLLADASEWAEVA